VGKKRKKTGRRALGEKKDLEFCILLNQMDEEGNETMQNEKSSKVRGKKRKEKTKKANSGIFTSSSLQRVTR